MLMVRKMSLSTDIKGKTIVEEGKFRDLGEFLEVLSEIARITFLDLDNYFRLSLTVSSGEEENEFYIREGKPFLTGKFVILDLEIKFLTGKEKL